MTDAKLVVDLSANDLGKTDVAGLMAHGVAAAILSPFSKPNPPHDMAGLAELCRRGGLPILSWYGLPYFGDSFAEERDLRWCVELAREYAPLNNTLFADCENDAREVGWDNAPAPTADQRVEALWRVKRDIVEAAGHRFGVYSGTFWWRDHMGKRARSKTAHGGCRRTGRAGIRVARSPRIRSTVTTSSPSGRSWWGTSSRRCGGSSRRSAPATRAAAGRSAT